MENVVVNNTTDSVLSVSYSTNTVNTTSVESVVVENDAGTVVTVGTDSAVLIEVEQPTVLVTGLVGPAGPTGTPEDETMFAKRVDFVTDNEMYRGEAVVGSSESNAVWRIRKIIIAADSDVTETWAGGTANFDKIWADRASLIYS